MESIPDYEQYKITENGEVFHNGKELSSWKTNSGYLSVSLCKNGKKKNFYIHRLVASVYLNNKMPIKETVNHIDGNKENNRVSNLEIISQSENNKHAYRIGLKEKRNLKGENNGNSKLTEKDILFIRNHYKPRDRDWSGRKLAEMFNVTPATISDIIKGKLWKELICYNIGGNENEA